MSYNNNKNNIRYIIVEFYSGEQIKIFNDKTPKKAANQAFSYLLQFMNVNESQEDFLLGKFLPQYRHKKLSLMNKFFLEKFIVFLYRLKYLFILITDGIGNN